MNVKKVNAFLFILWLTVGILTTAYGLYRLGSVGFQAAKMELFLPCIAWAFFIKAFMLKRRLDRSAEEPDA